MDWQKEQGSEGLNRQSPSQVADKALDDRIIHSLFKTICIECELNVESRNISNHSGRRTSIMELFNIGVPENTGCAISGHKSSGRYYAYTKPTDKHKREALANILNKIINTELSNETAQDLIINTAIFNKTAQDSVEHINSEFNNNEELQSIRSEDDELSDVDLNNSVQMEQKEHKFYEKFHTAREIFNNSHKRALNITDENEQLHNHKKNELEFINVQQAIYSKKKDFTPCPKNSLHNRTI
ncbi:hypothetical protein C2G38_2224673 [Gigaspora rosea]|uniref:Uncharacterized protein n=1 Tax=Gigaspora rosea TaxID=44941 RepID=A0A397U055_9GLOM|nr:hypothetical protein C2G38_2224673 [Gigaspora rosea]